MRSLQRLAGECPAEVGTVCGTRVVILAHVLVRAVFPMLYYAALVP